MLSVVDSTLPTNGGEACGLDAVETLLSLFSLVAGDVDSGSGLSSLICVVAVVDLCDSMARIKIWSPLLLLLGERQVCSLRTKLPTSLSCFDAGGMQQFNNFSSFELLLVLVVKFVLAVLVGDANGETLCWDSATGEGERVGEDNAFDDANDADDDSDDTEEDTVCADGGGDVGMGDEEPAEDNAAWLTSVCAALAVTRCCTIIIMKLVFKQPLTSSVFRSQFFS